MKDQQLTPEQQQAMIDRRNTVYNIEQAVKNSKAVVEFYNKIIFINNSKLIPEHGLDSWVKKDSNIFRKLFGRKK
jgi:hypothetical protein